MAVIVIPSRWQRQPTGPVEIDWNGSANLAQAKLRHPVPQRFELFGIETTGYAGNVILPVEATLAEAGKPASLRAGVDLLVCEDVCIPYRADLSLDLPAGVDVEIKLQ